MQSRIALCQKTKSTARRNSEKEFAVRRLANKSGGIPPEIKRRKRNLPQSGVHFASG